MEENAITEEEKVSEQPKTPQKYDRPRNPSKYTPITIGKLEQAWMLGCSDSEAAIFAGISRASLYNYLREDPDFKERRDLLKNWHSLMARRNIGMALARPADHGLSHSSIELSKWYLEKRNRDEFGPDKKEALSPGDSLASSFDAILKQQVEVKSSTLYIKKSDGNTSPSTDDIDGGGVRTGENGL